MLPLELGADWEIRFGPDNRFRVFYSVELEKGISDEEEIERLVLAYSPKFQAILASGRQQIQKTGGIAHEDFWQEMEAENEESLS